jgi:transcriptional regulator of acetoin/glycerol metabolism
MLNNNSYWKELLDVNPQLMFIFKVDEQEQAELVLVTKVIEQVLGYKSDEYILKSSTNSIIKADIDVLIDQIAAKSKGNKYSNQSVILLSTNYNERIDLEYTFSITKLKTSNYYHIIVLFNSILESNKLIAEDKQSNYWSSSDTNTRILNRINQAIELDQAIYIIGDKATGKTKLLKEFSELLIVKDYKKCFSLNQFAINIDQGHENDKVVFIWDDFHKSVLDDQKQLANLLLKAITKNISFQLVFSSTVSMDRLNEMGKIIPELYYRLQLQVIPLPPVKFRKDEINQIFANKLVWLKKALDNEKLVYSSELLKFIEIYNWPDNFESITTLSNEMLGYIHSNEIEMPELYQNEDSTQGNLFEEDDSEIIPFDDMQRKYLKEVLQKTDGVIYGRRGAAQKLGMRPTTLQSKLKRLGLR